MLDPDVIGLELELERYDLSLEHRRATDNAVVDEAAAAMRESGLRHQGGDDHARGQGRRRLAQPDPARGASTARSSSAPAGGSRASRRSPACTTRSPSCAWPSRTPTAPSSGARAPRARADEIAYRTEKITRSTCRAVAEYAFRTARSRWAARSTAGRSGRSRPSTRACSRRRWTPPPRAIPTSRYQPVLIDATYAGLITGAAGRAARHPGAEPRRRLPVGPGDADVRLDRRRRVGAAGLRRRLRDAGRDGRGARTAPRRRSGQGHRQPDGDDPGLRRGPALRRRCAAAPGAERASRAIYEAVLEATARRRPHARPRRPRRHDRVHRRRHRARAHEDRRLVLAGTTA